METSYAIAAQLYTLRDYLTTPKDIAASMKRLKSIGYNAVQLSGLGPIENEELVRILDGEGLYCCATHEPSEDILDNPDKVVDQLKALNCRYTAYPYPGGLDLSTWDNVMEFAFKLDHAGKVLKENDQVLTYHNHQIEFQRVAGKTVLEWLYEKTDPTHLQGELDTHWVQHGGGDPVAWCEKLKNRLPLLHLKDFAIGKDYSIQFAEIGSGNLNWQKILPAAKEAGCLWYIVEQDTCPGDPFDSLEKSLRYLKENFPCT
jgi:sugar phosphate isomerase/epimerase